MGSVHGEELPFVFGAPLVDGFGHFPRNYTRSEVALSESILQYFANFVRTGWVEFLIDGWSASSTYRPYAFSYEHQTD